MPRIILSISARRKVQVKVALAILIVVVKLGESSKKSIIPMIEKCCIRSDVSGNISEWKNGY